MSSIASGLKSVVDIITNTTSNTTPVRLVAVSKLMKNDHIIVAYNCKHRNFGENYVAELLEKSNTLPADINWHFIGALQQNKCKILAKIKNLFVVETIDSVKIATALDKACRIREGPLNVMIQVNTSNEDTKNGIKPNMCIEIAKIISTQCPNLKLIGLMCIGNPENSSSAVPNPDFQCLKQCRLDVETALSISGLELSMGMSDDFENAIAQGSTSVRVGSKIFGSRTAPPTSSPTKCI
jgi:pyridoxal phosphate enzyme (YggS family)